MCIFNKIWTIIVIHKIIIHTCMHAHTDTHTHTRVSYYYHNIDLWEKDAFLTKPYW